MKELIQHINERMKSETPYFFKKLIKLLNKVIIFSAGLGVAIYASHVAFPDFLPDLVVEIGKWATSLGVMGGYIAKSVASTTTTDPELSNKKI